MWWRRWCRCGGECGGGSATATAAAAAAAGDGGGVLREDGDLWGIGGGGGWVVGFRGFGVGWGVRFVAALFLSLRLQGHFNGSLIF